MIPLSLRYTTSRLPSKLYLTARNSAWYGAGADRAAPIHTFPPFRQGRRRGRISKTRSWNIRSPGSSRPAATLSARRRVVRAARKISRFTTSQGVFSPPFHNTFRLRTEVYPPRHSKCDAYKVHVFFSFLSISNGRAAPSTRVQILLKIILKRFSNTCLIHSASVRKSKNYVN